MGIVPRRPRPLPLASLPVHHTLTISFDAVQSALSFNRPQLARKWSSMVGSCEFCNNDWVCYEAGGLGQLRASFLRRHMAPWRLLISCLYSVDTDLNKWTYLLFPVGPPLEFWYAERLLFFCWMQLLVVWSENWCFRTYGLEAINETVLTFFLRNKQRTSGYLGMKYPVWRAYVSKLLKRHMWTG